MGCTAPVIVGCGPRLPPSYVKAAPHGAPSLIGRPPRPRFTAITYGGGVPWIAASNDERASNHERLASYVGAPRTPWLER